jgi:hypothetical protein
MKKTEQFELINGVFSAQLTHEILIDMLNKKSNSIHLNYMKIGKKIRRMKRVQMCELENWKQLEIVFNNF